MIYLIFQTSIKLIVIEYVMSLQNIIKESKIIEYTGANQLEINDTDIYIFFGIAYTIYKIHNKSNIYIINLEQLTMDGTHSDYNMLKGVIEMQNKFPLTHMLDYSNANCKILEKHGVVSRYLPYQVNKTEIYNYDKRYDYVLCCSYNARTSNIYNSLSTYFKNHAFIGSPCRWGIDRDDILMRSKVLLNVHHREFDYNILEEIRIIRCILNKVIVISERSQNQELFPLAKYIVFGDYDELPAICIDVLNNYDKYYANLYKEFDVDNITPVLYSYIHSIGLAPR